MPNTFTCVRVRVYIIGVCVRARVFIGQRSLGGNTRGV